MAEGLDRQWRPPFAQSPEDIRVLHQMCREGRLYEVERWIAEGKPLQVRQRPSAKAQDRRLLSR
jgi:hypothetical protein